MALRGVVSFLVMLLVVVAVSGCAKKEEPKPAAAPAPSPVEEGKALFEQKCSVCHGLDRATARTESREEWASIIKEMQTKKADWISDEEASKIAAYLSATHGK